MIDREEDHPFIPHPPHTEYSSTLYIYIYLPYVCVNKVRVPLSLPFLHSRLQPCGDRGVGWFLRQGSGEEEGVMIGFDIILSGVEVHGDIAQGGTDTWRGR